MVAEIGPVAAAAVDAACEGHVAAVFARSAYLDLGVGMVCVGAPELRRGALNALVDFGSDLAGWLVRLAPGTRVAAARQRLRIGGWQLELDRVRCWQPPRPVLPLERDRVARGLASLRAAAACRIPCDGLGFLASGAPSSNPLVPAGLAAARAMTRWIASGAFDVRPEGAHALIGLIGLGPGLTPSGDDFLGGALIGLRAFGRGAAAEALAAHVLPLCEHRTHPVSVAHLRAAAAGFGGEALHECLCAIADGGDPGACLDAIASTGHTSGWDALAGVVTVAAAI